jgi:aryl-alcohol dehydrogenase-like predicted oxidoreductase
MHDGPGGSGLSRKAIMEQIDASLARLGTDYVDLYQIHRFDPRTPAEETMEALHDVVKAGKARYLGASSMWAWQFSKMQYTADLHGWTRFVSMQNQYSLMQREEERDVRAARRPGRREHPVESAGQGPAGPAVGSAHGPLRR